MLKKLFIGLGGVAAIAIPGAMIIHTAVTADQKRDFEDYDRFIPTIGEQKFVLPNGVDETDRDAVDAAMQVISNYHFEGLVFPPNNFVKYEITAGEKEEYVDGDEITVLITAREDIKLGDMDRGESFSVSFKFEVQLPEIEDEETEE